MKLKAIKFFSPEENVSKVKAAAKAAPLPTGYISNSGKLVFPAAALADLGIDPESTYFKIGTQEASEKLNPYTWFLLQVPIKLFHSRKVAEVM
jgi:hypothetical protein